MNYCPDCGWKAKEDSAFCGGCGHTFGVSSRENEIEQTKDVATDKSSAVDEGDSASELNKIQPSENWAGEGLKGEERKNYIAASIVLLSLVIFALGFFVVLPMYQDHQREQLNISEAERVMDLIDSINLMELTAGCLPKIDRIYEEFSILTIEQRYLVRNFGHWEIANRIVWELIANEEIAADVVRAIYAIDFAGLDIEGFCVPRVREMYNALCSDQRALVTNLNVLEELERELERLIAEHEQRLRDEELARQERERAERERAEAEAARLRSAGLGVHPAGWLANTSSKSFTSPGYVITFYDTGRFVDTIRSGDYAFSYFNGRWEIYLAGYWYPFMWESRGGQEFGIIGVEERRFTRR